MYTNILNRRISKYTEDRLLSEQSEFLREKSCLNQIYVLNSVVRNRFNENKNIFVALFDFEKCFEYIDRELLLYRLFENRINGKICKAIR